MEKRINVINKPQIISILSGKGGVGKSIITYNLAAAAAHQGYRCLIIDCDWYFGNIHILANVVPKASLADVIVNDRHMSDAVIRIYNNLHLLPSPASPAGEKEINRQELEKFFNNCKSIFSDYDFVMIDTPSSMLGLIGLCAEISDINLITINPELTSISDGYGLFKYLTVSSIKGQAYLLINRAEDGTEYEYVYRKFSAMAERFLEKWPRDGGYVVENECVSESIEKQKTIFEFAADSEIAEQFLKLCNLLTENDLEGDKSPQLETERSINS